MEIHARILTNKRKKGNYYFITIPNTLVNGNFLRIGREYRFIIRKITTKKNKKIE